MSKQVCERCGRRAALQTVETRDGKQRVQLCAECVRTVIRPSTNYQVKK